MTSLSKPGLEATKWVAFALMIADHINGVIFDHASPTVYLLGRLVFPLFALALAEGLAAGGHLRAHGALKRLLVWALVAQVPWSMFDQVDILNVLFSLAAGLAVYLGIFANLPSLRRVLYIGVGACGSLLCEYTLPGLVMVVGALWYRESDTWKSRSVFALGLVLLFASNGTWFQLLAWPAFLGLRYVGNLPRIRHLFYYAYPAQWLVLAFAASRV